MDQLSPHHVPVYRTEQRRQHLWQQCTEHDQPVVAIRDARRGYIVRYDVGHLDVELEDAAVRTLRERTRQWRSYPTVTSTQPIGTDPLSESEGVGGEAGPVSGDLHTSNEADARDLASQLSAIVFDHRNWQ